jgi:hypothetical protein
MWIALSLLVSSVAFADKPAKAGDKGAAKPAEEDKLTGEVVDITCYANHGAKGDKHAACAMKCLQSGMPAGIVSEGKLFIATMKDHSSPATKLASFAGKTVTATGTKIERDGANIFEIDTVSPAK